MHLYLVYYVYTKFVSYNNSIIYSCITAKAVQSEEGKGEPSARQGGLHWVVWRDNAAPPLVSGTLTPSRTPTTSSLRHLGARA